MIGNWAKKKNSGHPCRKLHKQRDIKVPADTNPYVPFNTTSPWTRLSGVPKWSHQAGANSWWHMSLMQEIFSLHLVTRGGVGRVRIMWASGAEEGLTGMTKQHGTGKDWQGVHRVRAASLSAFTRSGSRPAWLKWVCRPGQFRYKLSTCMVAWAG